MQSAVPRVEDKIRKLCAQVLATEDEDELRSMLVELQNALRQHIQHLRSRFANYPFLVERRVRDVILPPSTSAAQNAVNETSATTRTDETKPDSKNISRADESAA